MKRRTVFDPRYERDAMSEAEALSFGVRCQDCGEWEVNCTCDQSGDPLFEDEAIRPLDFSDRNRQ